MTLVILSEMGIAMAGLKSPIFYRLGFLKKKKRSTSGAHLVWVGISAMLIKLFEHILVISKSSLHIGTTSTIVLSI
jgi:hypothetical protein